MIYIKISCRIPFMNSEWSIRTMKKMFHSSLYKFISLEGGLGIDEKERKTFVPYDHQNLTS